MNREELEAYILNHYATLPGLSVGGHTARRRIPSYRQPKMVCAAHGSAAGQAGASGNRDARYRQLQVRSDFDLVTSRRNRNFPGLPHEQSQLDHSCTDGSVSVETIELLLDVSYELTKPKIRRKTANRKENG